MCSSKLESRNELEFLEDETRLPGKNLRYLVAIAAAVSSDRYQHIAPLIQICLNKHDSLSEKVNAIQQIHETLFKCSAPVGMPKAAIGMYEASKAIRSNDELTTAVLKLPMIRTKFDIEDIKQQSNIYSSKIETKFMENNDHFFRLISPDFNFYVRKYIRGFVMAEISVLSKRDTELCVISSVGALKLDFFRTLHVKLALENQATEEMIQAVEDIVEKIRETEDTYIHDY